LPELSNAPTTGALNAPAMLLMDCMLLTLPLALIVTRLLLLSMP
jgi:hypothetical protein